MTRPLLSLALVVAIGIAAVCLMPEVEALRRALIGARQIEDAVRELFPTLEGFSADIERLRRIEHAARDVDGLWSEGRKLLHWEQEAGEALSDLRAALVTPPEAVG